MVLILVVQSLLVMDGYILMILMIDVSALADLKCLLKILVMAVFFGVYAASQCQLLNNVSGCGSSSSSAEFRNAPYAQVFVESISSVDFVVNRKSLKLNIYCSNQLKDKGQVISRKARKTKRKVEKNGSKPLEPNTKRDRKSEEIPLEGKVLKERGTTFENTSQPGNFDTSRRKIWSEVKVS